MMFESFARRASVAASSAAVCVLLATKGLADPPGAGPAFEYDAPDACPPADVFGAELRVRLRDAPLTGMHWAKVVVRIEPDASGFRGLLRIPESSDGSVPRELRSASCSELVRALALVGSVLIAPHRSEGETASMAPKRGTGDVERGPATAEGQSGPEEEAHTSERSSGVERLARRPVERGRDGSLVFVGAAGVALQAGPAPEILWGPRLFLGADYQLSPSGHAVGLRLSATQSSRVKVQGSIGDAELTWQALRFEGCGVLRATRSIAIEPCATFELGRLSADGRRAANPLHRDATWSAAGGVLRVRAELGRLFFLYADGALSATLTRPHFYFVGQSSGTANLETVYQVPPTALAAEGGAGVHFP